MDHELQAQILLAWNALPDGCRKRRATESELEAFETQYGRIPEDHRWFLQACGGGTIGSEWVDGIQELGRTHEKFLAESTRPNGWTITNVFVIGWDGTGNPFGIHRQSGRILVEDHNFGGVHELAPSLAVFLLQGLNM